MRKTDVTQHAMFSYRSLEERIPATHPLRKLRVLFDEILKSMNAEFEEVYSRRGRPSIAPERLLRASLLQTLFTIRSERQLVQHIEYNLLYRWFVGLPIDAGVWHPTVFSHNRDRLMAADVAREFLAALMGLAQVKTLLSSEHFSVDGTLIDAWASMKSFQPKDGSAPPPGPGRNGERDFHGQKRSNETHSSTTDPDARLYRKSDGQPSRLCYMGGGGSENGPGDRFPDDGADGEPAWAGGGGHTDPCHRHGGARGDARDAGSQETPNPYHPRPLSPSARTRPMT